MKKIFLLAGLIIMALAVQAQTPSFRYHVPLNIWYNGMKIDSLVVLKGTDTADYPASTSKGAFMFQLSDAQYYYSNGVKWGAMSGGLKHFSDSLAAHAVTVMPPLFSTDTTIGLDTSSSSPIQTKTYVHNNYVTLGTTQTIAGAKTFSSDAQFLGPSSTARFINNPSSGATRSTWGAEFDFEPSTPQAGLGSALIYRSYNASKVLVVAGVVGSVLKSITAGNEVGEVYLTPAWHGVSPDNNQAGVRVIATGANQAVTHITGGGVYLDNAPATGSTEDEILLRHAADSSVRSVPFDSVSVGLLKTADSTKDYATHQALLDSAQAIRADFPAATSTPTGFVMTTDADYTVGPNDRTIILIQTTALRTLTLGTPTAGRRLDIVFHGTGSGQWQTDATGYVADGMIGTPPYTTTGTHGFSSGDNIELVGDGTKWYQIN